MAGNIGPARTRFAPSPTGFLHLGGARTALYDYLLAKQTGGQFILRIEDTDRKRLIDGSEEELMRSLRWLGLQWDEGPDIGGPYGPYRQSERREIYQQYAQQLINSENAYYCFCTSERLEKVRQEQQRMKQNSRYDGTCRNLDPDEAARRVAAGEKHVVRFRMPQEGTTVVQDLLRGDITIENRMLDDYILVKSDGLALYHLAVVVDDHLMKITHAMRSSEWLPTFPLHSRIYQALGWEEPTWVHLSVFLKPSGKGKMSKRDVADIVKDGYSIFVKDMERLGYLPEGVTNWIALMGWGSTEQSDFLTSEKLKKVFNLGHLSVSPAAIDFTKFDHFNSSHIRNLATEDLAARIKPFFVKQGLPVDDKVLLKVTPLIRERIVTLDEATDFASFFFRPEVTPNPSELIAKGLTASQSLEIARESLKILAEVEPFNTANAEHPMRLYVEQKGLTLNQVFGILRIAVTGQRVSPPLFESMEIVGKEKVLERLNQAIIELEKLQ